MATTSDYLKQLQTDKNNLATKLKEKGVDATIDETFTELVPKIDEIKSGNNIVEEKDINFYDYDGTLLYSYTLEELNDLTELPPLPTQQGLICQGWNWTLEDIKEDGGPLNVGALYVTEDGKTRIYIKLAVGVLKARLFFTQSEINSVEIDWGDNTPIQTKPNKESWIDHNYAKEGEYIISLTPKEGKTFGLGAGSNTVFGTSITSNPSANYPYYFAVKKIEVGSGVTSILNVSMAFMETITIPNNVNEIGMNAFRGCKKLKIAIIPNGVQVLSNFLHSGNTSLIATIIPRSVTSIGMNAYTQCLSLTKINIPNNVLDIGDNAFERCENIINIKLSNKIKKITNSSFKECILLTNVVFNEGITEIGSSSYSYCYSLDKIIIPEGVTTIGQYAFSACYSNYYLKLPSTLETIASYAFNSAYGLVIIDCRDCSSIPSLENIAFSSTFLLETIIVPDNLYDDWISATNWSSMADFVIKESDYNA